jgi:hypothetical protein
MKKNNFRLGLAVAAISLLTLPIAMAKPVNLHEQPQQNSKVIGTIEVSEGFVPIFTPKDGNWIKIGDPRNGNVGWVQSSDLSDGKLSFHFFSTGNGGQGYQVIQFGSSKPYSSEQVTKMMQEMQKQELVVQKDVQQMMQHLMQQFQHEWDSFPIMMPVIVVPQQKQATPQTTTVQPAVSPSPAKK